MSPFKLLRLYQHCKTKSLVPGCYLIPVPLCHVLGSQECIEYWQSESSFFAREINNEINPVDTPSPHAYSEYVDGYVLVYLSPTRARGSTCSHSRSSLSPSPMPTPLLCRRHGASETLALVRGDTQAASHGGNWSR